MTDRARSGRALRMPPSRRLVVTGTDAWSVVADRKLELKPPQTFGKEPAKVMQIAGDPLPTVLRDLSYLVNARRAAPRM
jgi:hypothetical protein